MPKNAGPNRAREITGKEKPRTYTTNKGILRSPPENPWPRRIGLWVAFAAASSLLAAQRLGVFDAPKKTQGTQHATYDR